MIRQDCVIQPELHWLPVTATDQVQTLPVGSQSDGRSSAELHRRSPDTDRSSRRFRHPEAKTENRRTCIFRRDTASVESAIDRVETVSIDSTVQAQA